MKRLQWLAAVVAVSGLISAALFVGFGGSDAVYSQAADQNVIINNSGRALQVMDGVSGQPVSFGGEPWVIQPGQSFYSFPWQGSSRFQFGNRFYHYIGSVPGSTFQFFLVEDWLINAGQATPPSLLPTVTPTPAVTPTPTTPYVPLSTSYLPNCGLTQVKGRIVNPDGAGRGGVKVRVTSGEWSAVSNPSNNDGYWDVLLDSKPKDGTWNIQVWDGDTASSPVVTVQTNTTDCGQNGGGHQVAVVDFKKQTY